jgi:hypothetical protein
MKATTSLLALFVLAALAQEDSTRQLWNTEFLKNRPAGKGAVPAAPVRYKPLAESAKAAAIAPPGSETMLGVTLWRMRAPKPSDAAGTRLLLLDSGDQSREQTPERIDAATPLGSGDEVRITIEVPRAGYLYVIDRERYRDGTMSDPYLIYPNWQTRQGDNAVAPGRLLEIPDRRDRPNYFRIRPTRPDQVAEVLSLLVTPEPVSGISITHEALPPKLDPALYAGWEKKWAVKAERFELEGGTGKVVTEKENKTGADHSAKLTQDDPPPQTLYRIAAKPGSAVLLEIPLQLKK